MYVYCFCAFVKGVLLQVTVTREDESRATVSLNSLQTGLFSVTPAG